MDARTTVVGPVDRVRPRVAMPPAAIGVWIVLAALSAGCRVDPNIQLMEQELRLQDQRIFELEEHLADCHTVVAEHQRENATLKRQLDGSSGRESTDTSDGGIPETGNGFSIPRVQVDDGDEPPGAQRAPPRDAAESAPPFNPADAARQDSPTPARGNPPEPMDEGTDDGASRSRAPRLPSNSPTTRPTSELLPAPSFSTSAAGIEQIGLRLAVRYYPAEHVPMQVDALVEPQDSSMRQVDAAGDVSLMIVAADGETERQLGRSELARWEFAADDAQLLWSKSSLGTGFQFELPWPGSPQPGAYRMWVRFVGDDGRKHLGSVDFNVSETQLARRPPPRELLQNAPPQEGPLLVQSPSRDEQTAHEQPSEPLATTASPEVAWRKSTDAARLPRQQVSPTNATAESTRLTEKVDANPQGLWSPNRPRASSEPDAVASSHEPEWSAHR